MSAGELMSRTRPTAGGASGPAEPIPPVRTAAGGGPGPIRPVFVDRTGRRRRLVVLAGVGLGAGLLVSLLLIAAGLVTSAPVSLPGWPDGPGRQGREDAGIGRSAPSPTGRPDTARSPTVDGPPAGQPTPGTPRPQVTDRPGQGDLHRNPAAGKPSRPPGKPGRSASGAG